MPVRNFDGNRKNVEDGITKPAIRRLARRAGVKRIKGDVYDKVRTCLYQQYKNRFLSQVVKTAITYVEHRREKTVTVMDILQALRHEGRTLYGYGEPAHPNAAGSASKKKKKQPEKTKAKASSSSSSSSSTGGSPASVPALPSSFSAVHLSPDVIESLSPVFFSPQSSASPKSPRLDPYFGNMTDLQERLGEKASRVEVLTADEFSQDPKKWWKATEHIRKGGTGCPSLDLKTLVSGVESNPSYRIYNVMGEIRKDEKIRAFLILRMNDDNKLEIDYACSFHTIRGIMKVLIETLKRKHDYLTLEALLRFPLDAVQFWYKFGFRPTNRKVDKFLEETQGKTIKVSDITNLLAQDPNWDGLARLKMVYKQ
jgi:histone H4